MLRTTKTEGICLIIGGKQLHSYSKGSQRRSDTSLVFSPRSTAVLCFPHLWLCSSFCNRLHLSHFKANSFILESIPLPTALPSLIPGVVALCPSQQLPPQIETLSQTGNPDSPPLSPRSQGTWDPWAPRTGPSCLPPLQKDNLGMGRARTCWQSSQKHLEGMGWGCQPLSTFIGTAAGLADSPIPHDGAGH